MTETIQPNDGRRQNRLAKAAVNKELQGLFEQGVFECVKKSYIPRNAIILPSNMVYTIKAVGTAEEKYKARLTAGGHRDHMKDMMIHNSTNVRPISIRTLISTASIKRLKFWSKDADQAFIQSDGITRDIFIKPPP